MFRAKCLCNARALARTSLVLAIIGAGVHASVAQTLTGFQHLSARDGLAFNHVFVAFQDSQGYMWFGTQLGLSRWDGYEFDNYLGDNKGGAEVIFAIHEDASGNIWVGSADGLLRLNRQRDIFESVPVEKYLSSESDAEGRPTDRPTVSGIYEARSKPDIFWLSTFGQGLIRWDRSLDSMRVFAPDSQDSTAIPDLYVTTPLEDRARRMWVPTSSGLARMDRSSGTFEPVTKEPLLKVLEDPQRDGLLWLAERDGIASFNASTGVRERVVTYTPTDSSGNIYWAGPRSATWDSNSPGVLWTAATSRGLYRYDTNSGEVERYLPVLPDPDSLPPPEFRVDHGGSVGLIPPAAGPAGNPFCVIQDHAGVLWVCSTRHGISFADPSQGNLKLMSVGANPTAIAEGKAGRWWVGTGRPDVVMIDWSRGDHRHFSIASRDEDNGRIVALMEDSGGSLWVGQHWDEGKRGVLLRLDFERETVETYKHDPAAPDGFPPGGILALHEGSRGIVWAGTYGAGLLRIDPDTGTFTRFQRDLSSTSSLPSNWIWALASDTRGRLWLGGSGGTICHLDSVSGKCNTVFVIPEYMSGKSWNASDSLSGVPMESLRAVRSIVERAIEPGVLWLGTLGGLWRLDVETGEIVGPVSIGSVVDMPIASLVADEGGAIWIGSRGHGVIRYDPETRSSRTLDTPTRSLELGVGLLSQSGSVVFGPAGVPELWVLNPERSRGNRTPPRVEITRLDVVGRSVEEGHASPKVRGGEISLNYTQNSFTVKFVALHYSASVRNQYAYQLEGWDDVWHQVGANRSASFGRIPPGEYVFRVKAANSDGIWNEDGASLHISVLPPWWRTGWAHLLYALLVIGALVAIDRFQRRRVLREERKRAEIREAEIRAESAEERAQQLEELEKAKSRFFANVSHEFRTPLTVIIGPLREWSERDSPGHAERLRTQSSMMLRNAQRLLRLINQLLDLAKVESSRADIVPHDGDLVPFLRDLTRSFVPLAETMSIDLQFEETVRTIPVRFDADAMEKIVVNLLSNAIKFTDTGGKVLLSIEANHKVDFTDVVIRVRDTGVGIPPEEIESVFERFHRADTKSRRAHQGTGVGLALCRELVELQRGTIDVESKVGFGSTFTVRISMETARDSARDLTRPSTTETFSLESAVLAADASLGQHDQIQSHARDGGGPSEATILIVDDNSDVRAYLSGSLSARYRVVEAADGEVGLRKARDIGPDLVITDVMMPGIDGYELCRKIKSIARLRHVPVILLTARVEEEDRIRGLELGADDYLTKPFSTRELEVRVMNLLLSRRRMREQFSRELWIKSPEMTIRPEEEAFMEKVLNTMNLHLGDANFSTDVLADAVALSRRHVERRVKEITGETPSEFLRKMRLERAADILRKAPGSISEVAYAVGFKSPSHFAVAFKKLYGVTPSRFAENARAEDSDA